MPAPRRNDNATSVGLYTKHPLYKVSVQATASPAELAELARDLGDASLWIAERMAAELEAFHGPVDSYKLVGLYAKVAHECHQIAGELRGETGIKAAALGGLDAEHFDVLLAKQARSLSLILSQCRTAWMWLDGRVKVLGEKDEEEVTRVIIDEFGKGLPVLNYLAGHMRAAIRMMRDLAANRAWQMGLNKDDDDPATRIMAAIIAEKEQGKDDGNEH